MKRGEVHVGRASTIIKGLQMELAQRGGIDSTPKLRASRWMFNYLVYMLKRASYLSYASQFIVFCWL